MSEEKVPVPPAPRVSILRDFPRTFWVANVMELFERAAYYGLNSVLAVYLAGRVSEGGLGFGEQSVGFLQGIVYAATYVVPILGGALADRYGYRRMLLIAFSLLTTGYFAAGYSSSYALVFLSLLVMATGAGLFKPIISGTIARTTNEATSSQGFGIYYWMINLGAGLAPFVVTAVRAAAQPGRTGFWAAYVHLLGGSWGRAVFVTSALYCATMLLAAALAYREPPRPDAARKDLREVLSTAAMVLGDARFMLMVVLYSGFWILYFQNWNTVLWYLRDFVDTAPVDAVINRGLSALGVHVAPAGARAGWRFRLAAEQVTQINAATIILLQFLVSRIVKKRAALPTMVAGMGLGALGFTCLALSTNAWVFVLGVVVFSIGEMTAHPKYYSFVGLVAPADKKAVYMGYAFLYGVIGSLVGANLGSFLYERLLKPVVHSSAGPGRARIFWLLFAALDLVAMAGLWLFARAYGEDNAQTRRGARRVMVGVYLGLAAMGAGACWLGLAARPLQPRTVVQGLIFVTLGAGGFLVNRSRRAEA